MGLLFFCGTREPDESDFLGVHSTLTAIVLNVFLVNHEERLRDCCLDSGGN